MPSCWNLHRFPPEILVYLLEFIHEEDKVELLSSCKDYYHSFFKKYVRKLLIRRWEKFHENCDELMEKIKSVIIDPFNQLSLVVTNPSNIDLVLNIARKYEKFHALQCKETIFEMLTETVEGLRVKNLYIDSISATQIDLNSRKVVDCQTLSLSFHERKPFSLPTLIPSLKGLTLNNTITSSDSLKGCISYVQHLVLYCCSISDVSLLGSIPFLELQCCNHLVDISSLNNNDRVFIKYCNEIEDYSRSFANSRRIEISIQFINNCYIDLTKWRKVENLTLLAFSTTTTIHLQNDNKLPITVKQCELSKGFISSIDLRITSKHAIRELKLSNNHTIQSFEGYGYERLLVLTLFDLQSLQTLEGLEGGRFRKIVLCNCNKIRDFAALHHVPFVEIHYCEGFTQLSQIQSVLNLYVASFRDINFQANSYPRFLSLVHAHVVSEMDGLENIPFLQLDDYGYELIKRLLRGGKILRNERIVLVVMKKLNNNFEKLLLDLHHSYLEDQYEYFNRLPKRWIWRRKILS